VKSPDRETITEQAGKSGLQALVCNLFHLDGNPSVAKLRAHCGRNVFVASFRSAPSFEQPKWHGSVYANTCGR
jgi:hypothetical protein